MKTNLKPVIAALEKADFDVIHLPSGLAIEPADIKAVSKVLADCNATAADVRVRNGNGAQFLYLQGVSIEIKQKKEAPDRDDKDATDSDN